MSFDRIIFCRTDIIFKIKTLLQVGGKARFGFGDGSKRVFGREGSCGTVRGFAEVFLGFY
jgi:hypothetical protein